MVPLNPSWLARRILVVLVEPTRLVIDVGETVIVKSRLETTCTESMVEE